MFITFTEIYRVHVCEAEKNTAGLLYFWSPASKRANEAGPKKDGRRRVLCLLG